MTIEMTDVVVVGAGQAGLAAGYYLRRAGLSAVLLDRHERVGESWRERWDTLRLFTAAKYSGLPGMPFPGPRGRYPSKDEVADYLERYAREMSLPVRLGVHVRRVAEADGPGGRFDVVTDAGVYRATGVIVASGGWYEPRVPGFAADLDPQIVQFHSSRFRRASQVRNGPVLVVGASNSGAEIAANTARIHETWLAGRDTGQMPFAADGAGARVIDPLFWFAMNHLLTTSNPVGRRTIAAIRDHGEPLERVRRPDLDKAGVRRFTSRVNGVRGGQPMLADGKVLHPSTVIWATGFQRGYDWIDLSTPVVDDDGWPLQERGMSTRVPGLAFVGLPFQRSGASALLGGVGRDARYIVGRLAAETATTPGTARPPERVARAR